MARYKVNGEYKVLMVVMNLVVGDSRVIKCAETLHTHGFDVLLIGYNPKAGKTEGAVINQSFPFPCILVNGISRKFKEFAELSYEEFHELRERSFATEIQKLIHQHQSTILHTHDMHLVKVGKLVMEETGVYWIHDLHEWVGGLTNINPEIYNASLKDEAESIHSPYHLFTVSDDIATIYEKEYGLTTPPSLLLNVPYRFTEHREKQTLREIIGLDSEIPLAVYCGQVKETRGVLNFIPALKSLPDLHVALVTNNRGEYLDEIMKLAAECNASDRVHVTGYVEVEQLPHFLSTATFGFHTMPKYGNGDVALPNKLFEYIQSGLPVAVSNAKRMRKFVKEHNCGVIFNVDKPTSITRNVRNLLANISSYKPSEEMRSKFSWENEEKQILSVYSQIFRVGQIISRGDVSNDLAKINSNIEVKKETDSRIPVLHGPLGSAGQPNNLAKILTAGSKRFRGDSILTVPTKFSYSSDIYIPFRRIPPHNLPKYLDYLLDRYDIFHFHSCSFLWDPPRWRNPSLTELLYLKERGAKIVFHFRGTEIRNPEIFTKLNPFSYSEEDPYSFSIKYTSESQSELLDFLSEVADALCVVDCELQSYAPDSIIIPRTLTEDWKPFEYIETSKPMIVHAPSRPEIKGTKYLVNALSELEDEGLDFEYVQVSGLSNDEAKRVYEKADIIVDQLVIGWYGVLSVEAMALGKPVVAYIRDDLVPSFDNGLPLINANPNSIKECLRSVISDSEMRKHYSSKSREYFEKTHSQDVVRKKLETLYSQILSSNTPVSFQKFSERMIKLDYPNAHRSVKVVKSNNEEAFISRIKELKTIKAGYERQIKYLKRRDIRKSKNFSEATVQLKGEMAKLEHKLSIRGEEFTGVMDSIMPDEPSVEELIFSTYGSFSAIMEEDMQDLWVGDQTFPIIVRQLNLTNKCVVADHWGTLDGGLRTIIHYAETVGEIDLFHYGTDGEERIRDNIRSNVRIFTPISPRRELYDLICLSPPIAQIPICLSPQKIELFSSQLKPGGYLITHFVRSHSQELDLNFAIDDLLSIFPIDSNGSLIGLPDYIRNQFTLIANVDRICGSKSFISWLVLEKK